MLVNIFCGCGLLLFCTPGSGHVHWMQIWKLLFLSFSHHIDRHIFEHNEQLSKSRDEDSTAAITKTPVNIQSERRVLYIWHISYATLYLHIILPTNAHLLCSWVSYLHYSTHIIIIYIILLTIHCLLYISLKGGQ